MVEVKEPIQIQSTEPLAPLAFPKEPERIFYDDQSTLTKAVSKTEETYTCSKPELDKPRSSSPLSRLAHELVNIEKAGDAVTQTNTEDARSHLHDIKQKSLQQSRILKEAYEKSQGVERWTTYGDFLNMGMGVISSGVGYSMMTGNAPVLGLLLVMGGVLSITNTACKHTGIWDWVAGQMAGEDAEYKKELTSNIPLAVGLTATVLGLAGGIGAYFYADLSPSLTMLQTASNLTQTVATGGTEYAKAKREWTMAELTLLQSKLKFRTMDLENVMQGLEDFINGQGQVVDAVKRILRLSKKNMQTALQPV